MKIVEILGQIPIVISNEQHNIFRLVSDKGNLSSKKMTDYEIHIADHLCQKGLLYGEDKGKETIYSVAEL